MPAQNKNVCKLSHAESVLQGLKLSYIDELPHKIDALEQLALGLSDDGQFQKTYEEFFRCTHSLKGSAGTYGLYIVSSICHQLEDQLKIVDGEPSRLTSQLTNSWLQYIDLLREALDFIKVSSDSFTSIEKKLEDLRRSLHPNQLNGMLVAGSRYIVEICTSVIEQLPVQLSVLSDGYEALGRVIQQPFDFLITDKETEGINGLALITAAKLGIYADRSVRCILITSDTNLPNARVSDPDFVVERNASLAVNLESVVGELTRTYHQAS